MNVLVIDDQKEMGWIIKQALAFKRVRVEWVSSGQKGLERTSQEPFDLVLLDIDMPQMDGFETCRQLKSNEATKLIPVVFISGRTDPETRMKGLDLGAEYFLTKPFELVELWAIVHFLMTEGKQFAADTAASLIP